MQSMDWELLYKMADPKFDQDLRKVEVICVLSWSNEGITYILDIIFIVYYIIFIPVPNISFISCFYM